MKAHRSQNGHVVTTILIFVFSFAALGALGFLLYKNFIEPQFTETDTVSADVDDTFCASNEYENATNGVFCSEAVGIKFTVPDLFIGKLIESEDEVVYSGSLDPATTEEAGLTEALYKATVGTYEFTISKEPKRTGYLGIPHKLGNAYYDSFSGNLNLVDKAPDGQYVPSDELPSFEAHKLKIYKGSVSDAGTTVVTYFFVYKEKIIKIQLKHSASMSAANQAGSVFEQLDVNLRSLSIHG